MSVAHTRKLDKAWEKCNRVGIAFIPIAVESLGAWHKSAISEVKKLGSAKARQNGEEESVEMISNLPPFPKTVSGPHARQLCPI